MKPIIIPFIPNNLGRVDFRVHVTDATNKGFKRVEFKLDSGSDFTTISCTDLYRLGYTREFLRSCPHHNNQVTTAANTIRLQYIEGVSIKFEDREIQGCKIFFALDTGLRSLFGSDILKYFNWEVNYDEGMLRMAKANRSPRLSIGEDLLHIYDIGSDEHV